jgi:hypothetical protein
MVPCTRINHNQRTLRRQQKQVFSSQNASSAENKGKVQSMTNNPQHHAKPTPITPANK